MESARTSTQNYACRGRRAKENWGDGGEGGIQLTGTSFQYHLEGDYPVCREQRGEEGEGGTDEEQEQKDQQVRGHRQRIRSASGFHRAGSEQVQNHIREKHSSTKLKVLMFQHHF